MKLYKLLQKAYDYWKGKTDDSGSKYIDEENIYFTEGQDKSYNRKRMYIGEYIVGDEYISNLSPTDSIPSNIGNFQKGTNLKTILDDNEGSVSKVLDNVLFPTYAPTYYNPTYDRIISSDQTCFFVGENSCPYSFTNCSTALCKTPSQTVTAGAYIFDITVEGLLNGSTVSKHEYNWPNSAPPAKWQYTYEAIGEYTLTSCIDCVSGTSAVVDSKGNYCSVYSTSENTLLSDATENDWLEDSTMGEPICILSAREGCNAMEHKTYSCAAIFTDIYPYGASNGYTAAQCKEAYLSLGGAGMKITMGKQKTAYLLIPEGYTISGLYQINQGNVSDINIKDAMILDTRISNKKSGSSESIAGLYSNDSTGTSTTKSGLVSFYWYKYIFDNTNGKFIADESEYILTITES